jgi:hypothetical protein
LRDHFSAGSGLTLTVSLNGAQESVPASPVSSDYDCLYEQIPSAVLSQPGTLTLTFTDDSGKVEATGSLTVTAAP